MVMNSTPTLKRRRRPRHAILPPSNPDIATAAELNSEDSDSGDDEKSSESSDKDDGFPVLALLGTKRGQKDDSVVCNVCGQPVTGFRYTCVQCLDVDLCGACEARRQAHATHYVLRIPGPRPLSETSEIQRRVREALQSVVGVQREPDDAGGEPFIKTEMKLETGPDPLKEEEPELFPHQSNILEQAMVSVKHETLDLEPESESQNPSLERNEFSQLEVDAQKDQSRAEEGDDVTYDVKPASTAAVVEAMPITVEVPAVSTERRRSAPKRRRRSQRTGAPAQLSGEFKFEVFTHCSLPRDEPALDVTKAISKTRKVKKKS